MEKLVEYLFAGGTLSEIPEYVATHFTWHRFAAIQIWIFVLLRKPSKFSTARTLKRAAFATA
jgi:hypothetical protein